MNHPQATNAAVRFQQWLPVGSTFHEGPLFSPTAADPLTAAAASPAAALFSPRPTITTEKSTDGGGGRLAQAFEDLSVGNSPVSTIFFSPVSSSLRADVSALQNSPSMATNFSTQSSYKSLRRIDMLSLEYIRQCTSVSELEHIVQVLEADRDVYPTLWRTARERRDVLTAAGKNAVDNNVAASNDVLELSLSYSHSHEYSAEADGAAEHRQDVPRRDTLEERRHHSFNQRLRSLTQQILELEQEQTRHLRQIQTLMRDKRSLQDDVSGWEARLSTSTARSTELQHLLQSLEADNVALHKKLQVECTRFAALYDQHVALDVELQGLTGTYKSLQTEHNETQRESATALVTLQHELEAVRRERNSLYVFLLKQLDRSDVQLDHLTKLDRESILSQYAVHVADHCKEMTVLRTQLRELEQRKSQEVKSHGRLTSQMESASRENRRLSRENNSLTLHMQKLAADLDASRQRTKALSEQLTQQTNWQEQERMYQKIVRDLKDRLRKEDAMVSIALYKSAVAESRAHKARAQELEKELRASRKTETKASAGSRVSALSSKIPVPTTRPPPPPAAASIMAKPTITSPRGMAIEFFRNRSKSRVSDSPAGDAKPSNAAEETASARYMAAPTTPHRPALAPRVVNVSAPAEKRQTRVAVVNAKAVGFESPPPTSSAKESGIIDRAAILRAAGGRKGLLEQVKRVRSPKVATHM